MAKRTLPRLFPLSTTVVFTDGAYRVWVRMPSGETFHYRLTTEQLNQFVVDAVRESVLGKGT